MIRNNKWKLLISSLITLLPIAFGLLYWNELPMQITTHWGADGAADGWSSRAFAVFAIPLILLAFHWLCILITAKDPKNKDQHQKVFSLIFWIIPVLSLTVNGMMYAVAFGKEIQPLFVPTLILGVFFVFIGNYFPKCKQNHTIGIKIKWTLKNEENWNATHRLAGKIWVVGGLAVIACMVLPESIQQWLIVSILVVVAIVPIIYSWLYHKKQVREGTAVTMPTVKGKSTAAAIILTIAVLGLVVILIFTGEINVQFGETSFTIEASYWSDLTVEYAAIENLEYRDSFSRGIRANGLGGARLLAGTFENDEFGYYTLYSYTNCDACVILKAGGKTLVLGGPDAQSSSFIYETLAAIIE